MRDYTYLGTFITNKNELKPESEKWIYKHVEHIVHFFSTKQSISTQKKTQNFCILVRPLATYGAESWTLNKDIAKRLAAFERKTLRRMFRGIKMNENGRKPYNKELMQLFGDYLYFICRN
jgi:hypothetical protein